VTALVSVTVAGLMTLASISLAIEPPGGNTEPRAGGSSSSVPKELSSSSEEDKDESSSSSSSSEKSELDPKRCYHFATPCLELNKEKCMTIVACTNPACNIGYCIIPVKSSVRAYTSTKSASSTASVAKNPLNLLIKRVLPGAGEKWVIPAAINDKDSIGKIIPLGCFTKQSFWTEKRTECDTNQREHLWKHANEQTNNVSDAEIKSVLRVRFLGSSEEERARKKLLETIDSDLARLVILRDRNVLSEKGQDFVVRTINWLELARLAFEKPGEGIEGVQKIE
jgi:hypothetical protein